MTTGILHLSMSKFVLQVFDMKGDGLITKAAFRHVLANLGEDIDGEDVDRIVDDADKDGDGKLNFHEFKQLFSDM